LNCLVSVVDLPGGPTDRLCPCGVPKEAMAATGPDGRMVPNVALENRYSL
jgi:hypothetical protein